MKKAIVFFMKPTKMKNKQGMVKRKSDYFLASADSQPFLWGDKDFEIDLEKLKSYADNHAKKKFNGEVYAIHSLDENLYEPETEILVKDKITFKWNQEINCDCDIDDVCNCEPEDSVDILVNGSTGYGFAIPVQDNNNNELVAVKFLGANFEVKRFDEIPNAVEVLLGKFDAVEVSNRIELL